MTVDMRIRVDGEPTAIELAEFFEVRLPHLFAAAQDRLRPSVQELAPRPLTVTVGNRSWSMRADDARVDVCAGSTDGTVLRVDADQLDGLAADRVTPMGCRRSRSRPQGAAKDGRRGTAEHQPVVHGAGRRNSTRRSVSNGRIRSTAKA